MTYDTKEQAELEFVHDGFTFDAASGLWHRQDGAYEGFTGIVKQNDAGKWVTDHWKWY